MKRLKKAATETGASVRQLRKEAAAAEGPGAPPEPGMAWHKPFEYRTKDGKTIRVAGHWERKPGAGARPRAAKPSKAPRQANGALKVRVKPSMAYEARATSYMLGAADALAHDRDPGIVERFLRESSGIDVHVRKGPDFVEFGFPRKEAPREGGASESLLELARKMSAKGAKQPDPAEVQRAFPPAETSLDRRVARRSRKQAEVKSRSSAPVGRRESDTKSVGD